MLPAIYSRHACRYHAAMLDLLLSPRGRLDRTVYITALGLILLAMLTVGFALGTLPAVPGPLILSGVWIVLAWPLACLTIKRFRDTGHGPAALWLFAPMAAVALISLAMSSLFPGAVLIGFGLIAIVANLLGWAALLWLMLRPSL